MMYENVLLTSDSQRNIVSYINDFFIKQNKVIAFIFAAKTVAELFLDGVPICSNYSLLFIKLLIVVFVIINFIHFERCQ